jgi:hypothetical protein
MSVLCTSNTQNDLNFHHDCHLNLISFPVPRFSVFPEPLVESVLLHPVLKAETTDGFLFQFQMFLMWDPMENRSAVKSVILHSLSIQQGDISPTQKGNTDHGK